MCRHTQRSMLPPSPRRDGARLFTSPTDRGSYGAWSMLQLFACRPMRLTTSSRVTRRQDQCPFLTGALSPTMPNNTDLQLRSSFVQFEFIEVVFFLNACPYVKMLSADFASVSRKG